MEIRPNRTYLSRRGYLSMTPPKSTPPGRGAPTSSPTGTGSSRSSSTKPSEWKLPPGVLDLDEAPNEGTLRVLDELLAERGPLPSADEELQKGRPGYKPKPKD